MKIIKNINNNIDNINTGEKLCILLNIIEEIPNSMKLKYRSQYDKIRIIILSLDYFKDHNIDYEYKQYIKDEIVSILELLFNDNITTTDDITIKNNITTKDDNNITTKDTKNDITTKDTKNDITTKDTKNDITTKDDNNITIKDDPELQNSYAKRNHLSVNKTYNNSFQFLDKQKYMKPIYVIDPIAINLINILIDDLYNNEGLLYQIIKFESAINDMYKKDNKILTKFSNIIQYFKSIGWSGFKYDNIKDTDDILGFTSTIPNKPNLIHSLCIRINRKYIDINKNIQNVMVIQLVNLLIDNLYKVNIINDILISIMEFESLVEGIYEDNKNILNDINPILKYFDTIGWLSKLKYINTNTDKIDDNSKFIKPYSDVDMLIKSLCKLINRKYINNNINQLIYVNSYIIDNNVLDTSIKSTTNDNLNNNEWYYDNFNNNDSIEINYDSDSIENNYDSDSIENNYDSDSIENNYDNIELKDINDNIGLEDINDNLTPYNILNLLISDLNDNTNPYIVICEFMDSVTYFKDDKSIAILNNIYDCLTSYGWNRLNSKSDINVNKLIYELQQILTYTD
uniref:Uncharacterized protein n=1 Tax=Pithovirus LCPAC102 TaxID=2506587 RepID=A0A4D5XFA0_9VIRU|nr:MAG: hypothetical protein LCPAC102_01780 [Pithovirus LCPAC102]